MTHSIEGWKPDVIGLSIAHQSGLVVRFRDRRGSEILSIEGDRDIPKMRVDELVKDARKIFADASNEAMESTAW